MYEDEFREGEMTSFEVSYREDWAQERVTDVQVKNIIRARHKFRTVRDYVRIYVDTLKDTVIRGLADMQRAHLVVFALDRNKVRHRMVLSLYNATCSILQIERQNICEMVFIQVVYSGRPVFLGSISFSGFF